MKILIVNTSDIQGGAARAAYRLHKSLLEAGVDSQMLVQNKSSDDYTVIDLADNKYQKEFNKIRPIIDLVPTKFYKNKKKTLFSSSWFGFSNIVDKINKINPDIVHLHWVSRGMLKIEDIAKIKAPIVWTLHDMWLFTGGCHYDEECGRYEHSCGYCMALSSNKKNDLSKKNFKRKEKIFSIKQNITIVGLSKWLNNCSKNSTLLKDKKHINLPNPIDTKVFKPFDKEKSRELWSLPKNKKLILFGAIGATSDSRKGFKVLINAIQKLQIKNIEFVVFGSSEPKKTQNFSFKTHYVGSLSDNISLITLYSAVDVMIVPSLQENLSNAIMESLSCATPVVAFDVGGNSDMIEHKNNGYLAKPFESQDLAYGIEYILNNGHYEKLCRNAREKVLKEFDNKVVASRYIRLYEDIINSNN